MVDSFRRSATLRLYINDLVGSVPRPLASDDVEHGSCSRNGTLWNVGRGPPLLRLDVGGPDHLAPLLGFFGDEFPEFGGCH